jgi:hypothetical protein
VLTSVLPVLCRTWHTSSFPCTTPLQYSGTPSRTLVVVLPPLSPRYRWSNGTAAMLKVVHVFSSRSLYRRSSYSTRQKGMYFFACIVCCRVLIISVQALYVAPPAQKSQQPAQPRRQGSSTTPPAPGSNTTTPGARSTRSQLVRLLAHLVLFLCCASPQHSGGNAHPTQQQSQGQAQTHATSSQIQHQQGQSQTQPVSPSTSVTPTALNVHTTASGTVSGQPRPLPLRTRIVLFLCCTSLPHADGH